MNELTRLEDDLLVLEARVALLDACRPIGLAREEARLEAVLRAPAPSPADLVPRLDWPIWPALDLERVRLEGIERACRHLAGAGGPESEVARILAERAGELMLGAQIVQARGTADLIRLARGRFVGWSGDERAPADRLAWEWLGQGASQVMDGATTVDLAQELRRLSENSGLAVVVRELDMVARAAVTENCLLVRRGARVTPAQSLRIFTHEVHGHWLPRQAARQSGCPFRIGPRGSDADEEGRALFLEQAGGHLDAARKCELAVRHLLAADVLDGRHPGEALRALHAAGVAAKVLASTAPRVLRAGGLCREIIYLPGLLRVGPQLLVPEVERVFQAGRATVAEAGVLTRLLPQAPVPQSRSASTGV